MSTPETPEEKHLRQTKHHAWWIRTIEERMEEMQADMAAIKRRLGMREVVAPLRPEDAMRRRGKG